MNLWHKAQLYLSSVMLIPYRAEYLREFWRCIDAQWNTVDAKEYAQLVVDDLRAKDNAARIEAGGLDVRDFSEQNVYGPDDYLPPLKISSLKPSNVVKPDVEAAKILIDKMLDKRCRAPAIPNAISLASLPRPERAQDQEIEHTPTGPVIQSKSQIPSFIKRPASNKKRQKLEDKWAGTLGNL